MATNTLSEAKIVAEALRLLNERGLDDVSLRNIAAGLGVRAPSLARHVGDKGALLARMSETIFQSCLDAMPPCTTWQNWLHEFGKALWNAQRSVRDASRLIVAANYDPEQLQAQGDSLSAKLGALGVPVDFRIPMQSSVQALITGWNNLAEANNGPIIGDALDEMVLSTLQRLIDGWTLAVDGSQACPILVGLDCNPACT
jgi:TetR/AcrR family tetracycline transcriptional repressor